MAFVIQINWFDNGVYKILDVTDKLHEQVWQFMWEYFQSNQLFHVLKISQDPDIENELQKIIKHILQDNSSLVVMNENKEIMGVALLKCMTRKWRSWSCLHVQIENEHFKELYAVLQWCRQQQFIKHPENPGGNSLHLFSFHLNEELMEDKEFLMEFFKAISQVARHMHLKRVTYLCLTRQARECMELAGFKEMIRIIYSIYVFKGKRPFQRLRDINEMYGGFYEKQVEGLKSYQEMIVRHAGAKEIKELTKN
ncbi:uncharacterized protein ACRADG_007572 [Cochliomyia hominivorax]